MSDESLIQSVATHAVISTGGDEGHAPARRVYEKAGYRSFPGVNYFKAL